MKIINAIIFPAIILAIFNVNEVAAITKSHKDILDFIEHLKPFYQQEDEYRRSNDYNDIKNGDTRQKIEGLCGSHCIDQNCGKIGAKKKIAKECQIMCPRSKIQSCLSKV